MVPKRNFITRKFSTGLLRFVVASPRVSASSRLHLSSRIQGAITKYYFAGAQRIAIRKDGELNYILSDHLGSTSLVTDSTGNLVSETRYTAWGEERYNSGASPTDYTYTGQYSNMDDIGLMFYNARWYAPSLNHGFHQLAIKSNLVLLPVLPYIRQT